MGAAAAVGAGLNLASGILTGDSEREAGMREQALYNKQAKFLDAQAREAEIQAEIRESIGREEAADLTSEQVQAYAASGVDIGSGSPLQILAEQRRKAETAVTQRKLSDIREIENVRFQSSMARTQGRAAMANAKSRARASLISGVAKSFGTAYDAGLFKQGTKTSNFATDFNRKVDKSFEEAKAGAPMGKGRIPYIG